MLGRPGGRAFLGLEHWRPARRRRVRQGRAAVEEAAAGAVVAVDLDTMPDRPQRVNNGTPRPLTVHQRILDERPDVVVGFLVQTLRAADWAADNLDGLRDILPGETRSGAEGVVEAYGEASTARCTRRSRTSGSSCSPGRRTSCPPRLPRRRRRSRVVGRPRAARRESPRAGEGAP